MTNPISPEEIRLLYQDQIDRISELKANQWRMSRYGLLIVASIFGVALTSALAGGHLSETLKIVLTIVAVVTAVGVLSLIHEFQGKTVHRRRALKILATLSDAPTGTFSEVRADLRERRQQPIVISNDGQTTGFPDRLFLHVRIGRRCCLLGDIQRVKLSILCLAAGPAVGPCSKCY